MLMESNRGKVWNNSFSFLSAIGLGMYESSGNKIMHNKIDWCVRGYSHGVYNRGQDSAGILIYEQSNQNLFAYNSVTHGGDGFFLFGPQFTRQIFAQLSSGRTSMSLNSAPPLETRSRSARNECSTPAGRATEH